MSSLWNRRSVAALLLLGGLAACEEPVPLPPPDGGGGGGTPMTILSTSPVASAPLAAYGLPVSAITSQPLNASTATVTSYTVAEDPSGVDAPRRILVVGGNQLQATASLMPNTSYRATITSALQSTTGSVLAAPYTWTFKTRPIAAFPLATGTSFFGHLALAADSSGGLHAVYADSLNGDLIYAECAASCALAANWSTLGVDTVGNVGSSSAIGVDRTGRVHMVFRSDRLQTLRYATCLTACTDLLSWSFATVDNSSSQIGINPSISVTPDGIVQTTYYDGINSFLRYARCLAACALVASWQTGTPDTGPFVGRSSAIVVDGSTRHVVYQDSGGRNLKYATCSTICTGTAEWLVSTVSLVDGAQDPAIALGPNKELAVTYSAAIGGTVKYTSCLRACVTFANWTSIDLATSGLVGQAGGVTMDINGRVQTVFIDNGLDRLRYATCSSVCTSAPRWRYSTVDDNIGITRSAVMVPGRDGALEMLYLATNGTVVKFAE
jgi:hypothetical protein